jgi:malate synthase A
MKSSLNSKTTAPVSIAAAGIIFSVSSNVLKTFPATCFPDRAQITMTRHCMHSYSLLAIKTCHRRGAYAIGGMAAQIPIKNDPEKNREALEKVRADKTREATDGHDGTWVAHPGLVPIAMEEFDKAMPAPNQIDRLREDVQVTAADLLKLPAGTITEGRHAHQHQRGHPVHGQLAVGSGLRAPVPPHGRRGHRRNLTGPAVAVDQPSGCGT